MSIHQKTKSLSARGSELSDTGFQLKVLNGHSGTETHFPPFALKAADAGFFPMKPSRIDVLQINIGKLCNQACAHCHVDAGPDKKTENMSKENLEKCLKILQTSDITTVDITGGAPEMNQHFRWFAESCRALGKKVMVRCNLTIILANKKYHDLPDFFAKNQIHVVSSLPYFSKVRTDAQRGDGVFEDSIKALQLLNAVGYGKENSGLLLDLVYNPSGAFLPGQQAELEREFKQQLLRRYGIVFNQLFVITNMPISRFLDFLLETNNYEEYMNALVTAFNPQVVGNVMCRTMVSVGWDGSLYDCDFNQMLGLPVNTTAGRRAHLDDFDLIEISERNIVLNQHCYGCTAGSGSSCGGELS